MSKKRIHINQHNIRHNAKCDPDERKPVITCKTYKANHKGNELQVLDNDGNVVCTVIYSPDKPLDCGAKVWIEAQGPVIIDGQAIE